MNDLTKKTANNYKKIDELANSNLNMFQNMAAAFNKLNEANLRSDVNTLMNTMLDRVESNYLREEQERVHELNNYLNDRINDIEYNLTNRLDEFHEHVEETNLARDVTGLVEEMITILEKKENRENNENVYDEINKLHEIISENSNVIKDQFLKVDGLIDNRFEYLSKQMNRNIQNLDEAVTATDAKFEVHRLVYEMVSVLESKELEAERAAKEDNEVVFLEKVKDLSDKMYALADENQISYKTLDEKIDKTSEEMNKLLGDSDVINQIQAKIASEELSNKVEFSNVYKGIEFCRTQAESVKNETREQLDKYSDEVQTITNGMMERMKKDANDQWTAVLETTTKFERPEDIKKILKSIPPVILNYSESRRFFNVLDQQDDFGKANIMNRHLYLAEKRTKSGENTKGNKLKP